MSELSTKLPLELMQTRWSSQLNPLLSNVLVQGQLIQNVSLKNGVTTIYHSLGQLPNGWILVDVNGTASIYRSQPFNAQTLTLTSNAAVTVSIWIF